MWVVGRPRALFCDFATVSDSSKLGVCGTPRGRREGKGGGIARASSRQRGGGTRSFYTFLSSRVVVMQKRLMSVRQQMERNIHPMDCQKV